MNEWHEYVVEQRAHDLNAIITEEKLKPEDTRKFMENAFRDGGYLTKEVLKELLELIRKAGDEKDKTAMVSINWPQAVIRVQYTDMQVQESVTIEEANEGEK